MLVVHGDEFLVLWLVELITCPPYFINYSGVECCSFLFMLRHRLFLCFAGCTCWVLADAGGFVRDWLGLFYWLVCEVIVAVVRFIGQTYVLVFCVVVPGRVLYGDRCADHCDFKDASPA